MLKHKDHFHGSDLEKIEEIYGIKKEDITSFSANVNPLGISPRMRTALVDHIDAVSYTHLDVYKRQPISFRTSVSSKFLLICSTSRIAIVFRLLT